jgi:hypothetical protein
MTILREFARELKELFREVKRIMCWRNVSWVALALVTILPLCAINALLSSLNEGLEKVIAFLSNLIRPRIHGASNDNK